jgi:aspartate/methionine/tyrosine aminotransferase
MMLSDRGLVSPFIAMDVLAAANRRAEEGKPVFHLELGQPSAPPPPAARRAALRAVEEGKSFYTEALGDAALRRRIAGYYAQRYGVAVDAERIVITAGASGGVILALLAAFDAGAKVVLPRPGYPAYRNILKALDLVPLDMPLGAGESFRPGVAALERLWREEGPFSGLLLASPGNPTGTVIGLEELRAIARWCRAHEIRLICDEIYHGIVYGEAAPTVLAADPDAVVINSFSKYFCMTGWRVGWMVVPDEMRRNVECLTQNLFVCASSPAQYAALAAFDDEAVLDARVEGYATGRALLLSALAEGGITETAPAEGAFYIYADISGKGVDSVTLSKRLLDETGIATTPGVDFDPVEGHRFLRLSYAGEAEMVAAAARRLGPWLRAL